MEPSAKVSSVSPVPWVSVHAAIVQRTAMQAWDEGVDFRSLLEADADIEGVIDPGVLDDAFDLQRSLQHIGVVFEQLDAIER